MKLVVFILCYNEAKTLPLVLDSIPKRIKGINKIEILIGDDGSTDETVALAKSYGVKAFIRHTKNQHISRMVCHGLDRALEMGADIIVITDGDNQYPQSRIPALIRPILDGAADTVIADRGAQAIEHLSPVHAFLQRTSMAILNIVGNTDVPNTASGFRAYSRQAAMQLNPVADYGWDLETLVQAGHKYHALSVIPIKTNPKLRNSQQLKGPQQHTQHSGTTIIRAFIMHRPYALFLSFSFLLFALGLIPSVNFLYVYLTEGTAVSSPQHLQGLIIGSVLLIASFISFTLGVITDVVRVNRLLIEDVLEQVKRQRMGD